MQYISNRKLPVQWHEGMLLSPQHFQQDQVYRDVERMHQLSLSSPYYWGVTHLNIDGGALLTGVIRVRSIYGMMQDGLTVNFNENLDDGLQLDVTSASQLELAGAAATVHLVVPIRDADAAHTSAKIQRFDSVASDAPVVDENTGENAVEVYRLKPRFDLYVGDNPPGKYTSIPLLRIRKENDGTYRATDFVPPLRSLLCPDVASAGELFGSLERLVQAIRQKAIQLSAIAESEATGLSRAERAKKRHMSEVLGEVLPNLELCLACQVHPFHAYAMFSDAIGRLVKITANPVPPKLPRYDHDDLRAAFNVIISCLANLLNVIKSEFKLMRFEEQDHQFSIQLNSNTDADVLTIEIRGDRGVSQQELEGFVRSARIVCEPKLAAAEQKRLLGAKRKILRKPIFESESERERVVIVIDKDDPFIEMERRLVISSTRHTENNIVPESIWLYSS